MTLQLHPKKKKYKKKRKGKRRHSAREGCDCVQMSAKIAELIELNRGLNKSIADLIYELATSKNATKDGDYE